MAQPAILYTLSRLFRLLLRAVAPALVMTVLSLGLLGQRVEARTEGAMLARASAPADLAAATGLVAVGALFPESPQAAVADAVTVGANRRWHRGVALLLALGSVVAALAASAILAEESDRTPAQPAPMG